VPGTAFRPAAHDGIACSSTPIRMPCEACRMPSWYFELRVFSREELGKLDIWPAHEPIRDAYLAFDGRLVVA
jgi:hypothetical protein